MLTRRRNDSSLPSTSTNSSKSFNIATPYTTLHFPSEYGCGHTLIPRLPPFLMTSMRLQDMPSLRYASHVGHQSCNSIHSDPHSLALWPSLPAHIICCPWDSHCPKDFLWQWVCCFVQGVLTHWAAGEERCYGRLCHYYCPVQLLFDDWLIDRRSWQVWVSLC